MDDSRNVETEAEVNAPIRKIIFTTDFFLLYVIAFSQIYYGYYIMGVYKQLGSESIKDDKLLTVIGSTGALVNGVFRVFWSTLLDFFSFKSVYRVLLVIQILMIGMV